MAIAYIIFSDKTGKFYTGSSHEDDVSLRLNSHNFGKVRSTRFGKPWRAVHIEKFPNYTEARRREIFLKTGVGRNWVKNNVKIV